MFGNNPIRKQELAEDGALAIQEIFYTIQGEGPFAGVPAVFVRTAGCTLHCMWCDSEFESGINNRLTPVEILSQVREVRGGHLSWGWPLVVLTGGEPFRQDIRLLIRTLIAAGYHVQIETAGTHWLPGFEELLVQSLFPIMGGCSIVISPKTGKVASEFTEYAHAWKYIIRVGETAREDGLPNMSTQVLGQQQKLARPPGRTMPSSIFLQPCEEYSSTGAPDSVRTANNTALAVKLCMRHGYRLSLQTHKILGLP